MSQGSPLLSTRQIDLLTQIAVIAALHGRRDEAQKILDGAASTAPDFEGVTLARAIAAFENAAPHDALSILGQAVKARPDQWRLQLVAAWMLKMSGHASAAQKAISSFEPTSEEQADMLNRLFPEAAKPRKE